MGVGPGRGRTGVIDHFHVKAQFGRGKFAFMPLGVNGIENLPTGPNAPRKCQTRHFWGPARSRNHTGGGIEGLSDPVGVGEPGPLTIRPRFGFYLAENGPACAFLDPQAVGGTTTRFGFIGA